jgi:hypothetical protein
MEIVMNLRTSIKPLTAAVAGAIVVAALSANVTAEITEPNNRIKPDYILADDMAQWLTEANVYALNPVNLRGGVHPDRADPAGGPMGVVYIFPDEASANLWWNVGAGAPMPTGIPVDAVAFIHWVLDNGSGQFPGIMSKSDIDGFKSRNCIMAAGEVIPQPGGLFIEKTCSNPQGSSKRFKLGILKHNVPIDLVYNVEPADLTYTNYDTLPTFDGVPESGRIYRILQKFNNTTGTDPIDAAGTILETREGARMAGFRLELGQGVGGAFTAIANGSGLEVDKTIGWELRPCMPDHFLDVFRDRPGTGTNPCSPIFDSTGQSLPQEIWLEEEYASFSPKNYSTRDDKRMLGIGIPGGFWDKNPSGVYPPEIQTLAKLDSGYKDAADDVYWDSRVDDPEPHVTRPAPGTYYGATNPNFYDQVTNIADKLDRIDGNVAVDYNSTNAPTPFPMGYLPWYGVLADPYDDVGIMPSRIVSDDDGLPSSEGDMIAWWDGFDFRWGIDGPVFDGVVEPENAYSRVDPELVNEWALFPLVEDCNETDPDAEDACPSGPVYEVGIIDDLGGLNIDSFVYLGRNYDPVANPTFTVRLTTVSVDNADPYGDGTVVAGFPITTGIEDGAWVLSPPPALESLITADGIIAIQEPAYIGEDLVIALGDTDAGLVTLGTETVTVTNDTTGETETVVLTRDVDLTWRFDGTLPTAIDPAAGASNDGTLNTWLDHQVTVTYVDANTGVDSDLDGVLDTNVTKTDTVIMTVPVLEICDNGIDDNGDGLVDLDDPFCEPEIQNLLTDDGGFCSYNPNGRFDPVLPALVLIGLGYLGLRRKIGSAK